MKMNRILLGVTFICCLNVAWAENVQKLGYVNPERVYTETKTAQHIESNLQQEFASQQQVLAKLQQEGMALQQKLSNGKLSTAERKKLEAQLVEKGQQYRITAARLAEEYNLRRNEEFAALQNSANDIIKNIAEREKYDLIVQEAVFVSKKYDITDRVIKLLNESK